MTAEDLLRDALAARADATVSEPTPVAAVEVAARRLRRRRRTLVSVGAALATAAVVVPIALVAGGGGEDASRTPAASGSTAPSDVLTTASDPDTTGRGPRLGYALDGRFTYPGGPSVPVPRDTVWVYSSAEPFVALDPGEDGPLRLGYVVDGRLTDEFCGSSVPVVGDGDAELAFTTVDCADPMGLTELTYQGLGDSLPVTTDVPAGSLLMGFTGFGEIAYLVPDVGVSVIDLSEGPGASPRPVADIVRVSDAHVSGLVAGQVDDTTATVYTRDGEQLWTRPDTYLGTFSPDGRYVLATRTDSLEALVLDARDGSVVTTVTGSGPHGIPTMGPLAWEDDRHLVTTLQYNSAQQIVRVGLDGSVGEPISARLGLVAEVIWAARPQ